jgi:hypothetical protein
MKKFLLGLFLLVGGGTFAACNAILTGITQNPVYSDGSIQLRLKTNIVACAGTVAYQNFTLFGGPYQVTTTVYMANEPDGSGSFYQYVAINPVLLGIAQSGDQIYYNVLVDGAGDGGDVASYNIPACVIFTATATPLPSNTASPTMFPSRTGTQTRTPTRTVSPSFTATPSRSPTRTTTPTRTLSFTSTYTVTATPTATATATRTVTKTATITKTFTASPTAPGTFTATPTITKTATPTLSFTVSPTRTSSFTASPTVTPTYTLTPCECTTNLDCLSCALLHTCNGTHCQ